jgi:hypothetical protein
MVADRIIQLDYYGLEEMRVPQALVSCLASALGQ